MSEKISYSDFEKAMDDVREVAQESSSENEFLSFVADLKEASDLLPVNVDAALIEDIIELSDDDDAEYIAREIRNFAEELELSTTYNLLLKILELAKGIGESKAGIAEAAQIDSLSVDLKEDPEVSEALDSLEAGERDKAEENARYQAMGEKFGAETEAAEINRITAEVEGDFVDKHSILAKNFPDKDESSYSHVDFPTREGLSRSVLNDAGINISMIEGLPNVDIRPFIFNSHGLTELRISHIQPLSFHLKMNLFATSEVDIVAAAVLIGQAIKKGKEKGGDFREILSFEGESSLETLNRLYEYVYSEEPDKFDDAVDAAEVAGLEEKDRHVALADTVSTDADEAERNEVAADIGSDGKLKDFIE